MRTTKVLVWAVLLAGVIASAALAQQIEIARKSTRAKLWTEYRNTGTMGGKWDTYWGDEIDFMYPGFRGSWRDYQEFWGLDPKMFASVYMQMQYSQNMGKGTGVWASTLEPTPPDKPDRPYYNVTFSNPWSNQGIVPMVYDPKTGPEANLGENTLSPLTGVSTANYWAGTSRITNEPAEIHNYNFYKYLPNNKWPEEIIVSKWTTERGLTFTRRGYAWSYPDFDDFVIVELTVENTGDTDGDGKPNAGFPSSFDEVYLTLISATGVSECGHAYGDNNKYGMWNGPASTQDDGFRYSQAPGFSGLADLAAYRVAYVWDADDPGSSFNDTGQPFRAVDQPAEASRGVLVENQIMSPQYLGVMALGSGAGPFPNDTNTYVAPTGTQPIFVKAYAGQNYSVYDHPSLTKNTAKEILQELSGKAAGGVLPGNPTTLSRWTVDMTFGPYKLGPGDKAKVVVAYVAGTAAQFAGPGGAPMDEWEWMRAGDRSKIADGEKAMALACKQAAFAYKNNYDIPDAPPDVDVKVLANEEGSFTLSWSALGDNAVNPDYAGAEAQDVAGYRVYRSEGNVTGPWNLLVDVPKGQNVSATPFTNARGVSYAGAGTYSYKDDKAVAGFGYYYSVRAYSKAHADWKGQGAVASVEGGHAAPEERMPLEGVPFVIASAQKDQLSEEVLAVPNPFRLDSSHRYPGGSTRIRFVNILRQARIHIYNASGDEIGLVVHPSRPVTGGASEKGEEEWNQFTKDVSGYPSPGVYYFVVENLTGQGKKIARGSFVIIR